MSVINDDVRKTIRRRARQARTKADFRLSLFESLQQMQIDPWDVSLEDMKVAVLVAGRAVRLHNGKSPLQMPECHVKSVRHRSPLNLARRPVDLHGQH